MGVRHELVTPGAWVELRDVDDLRGRDRDAVWAAMGSGLTLNADGRPVMSEASRVLTAGSVTSNTIAGLLVERWEAPYLGGGPQPSPSAAQIGELKLKDLDRLLELVEPAVTLLMPSSATDPDDYGDELSPSGPASV